MKKEILQAKQLEQQYLIDDDVWKFQKGLQKLGFKDIPDYHRQITIYGHCNRTLIPFHPDYASEVFPMIEKCIKSGEDFFGWIIYKELTVYLPNKERCDEFLYMDKVKEYNIAVGEHFGEHGAFLIFPGNFGIMILLQPPANMILMDETLRRIVMKVLKEKYDIDTEEKHNDLMCQGLKIWGTTHGGTGGVIIVCGAMNINLEEEMINQIVRVREGHPVVKQGISLNELTGKEINAKEVVKAIAEEWLKATNSRMADDLWQTRL